MTINLLREVIITLESVMNLGAPWRPTIRRCLQPPRQESILFTKCISILCIIVLFQEPNNGLLTVFITLYLRLSIASFIIWSIEDCRLVSWKLVFSKKNSCCQPQLLISSMVYRSDQTSQKPSRCELTFLLQSSPVWKQVSAKYTA